MNIRVKICGITHPDDAWAAVDAGADALGFMFFEPSPRYITPENAARIASKLPPFVAKVGVFVNAPENVVRATAETCGLDTLQFHGDETPEFCSSFHRVKVIKSFRVRDAGSLREMEPFQSQAWLLDAFVAGKLGGTGEKFNWDLAIEAKKRNARIILAGGLTVANVRDAVHKVQPYAVDVSSGVESAPGKKDHAKVREFIAAAKGRRSP